MNSWKKFIAILCFSLVSLQTFSAPLLLIEHAAAFEKSDSPVHFKLVSFSEAIFADTGSKRINLDLSVITQGFLPFLNVQTDTDFLSDDLQESSLGLFDFYKADILSSVNLIFPFQYFW